MSYLGRNPNTDKTTLVYKLDSIAASFNSASVTFNLLSGGVAVYPGTTRDLDIAVNGVQQEPDVAYTISGSTITFSTAPTTGSTFWGVLRGTPNFDLLLPVPVPYAPLNSMTIANGFFMIMSNHLILQSTRRLTITGTGRLRIT